MDFAQQNVSKMSINWVSSVTINGL